MNALEPDVARFVPLIRFTSDTRDDSASARHRCAESSGPSRGKNRFCGGANWW